MPIGYSLSKTFLEGAFYIRLWSMADFRCPIVHERLLFCNSFRLSQALRCHGNCYLVKSLQQVEYFSAQLWKRSTVNTNHRVYDSLAGMPAESVHIFLHFYNTNLNFSNTVPQFFSCLQMLENVSRKKIVFFFTHGLV